MTDTTSFQSMNTDGNGSFDLEHLEEDQDLDQMLQQAREEWQLLVEKRRSFEQQRQEEVELLAKRLGKKQKALDKLTSSLFKRKQQPTAAYLQHWKDAVLLGETTNKEILPPLYVLKQQALLLQNMHATFEVLPKQIAIVQDHHQQVTAYLEKEQQDLQLHTQIETQKRLEDLSVMAMENTALYDDYQRQLEEIQNEMRAVSALCHQQKHEHNYKSLLWGNDSYTLDDMTVESTERSMDDAVDDFHHLSPTTSLTSKLNESFTNNVLFQFAAEKFGQHLPIG